MLTFFLILALTMSSSTPTASVNILLKGTTEGRGRIHVAIFADAASYEAGRGGVFEQVISVQRAGETYQCLAAELPAGNYAIAAYHDVNDNGELDTNLMGIPQEPYAFSNGASAKWRRPSFEEVAVPVSEGRREVTLLLKKWQNH